MRKELLIVVTIGIFCGVVIGFGIWRANKAISQDQVSVESQVSVSPTETKTTPSVPANNKISSGITISTPQEYDVVAEPKVKIIGLSAPNTNIAISSETNDYLVKSTQSGEFEVEVELIEGINQIIFKEVDSSENEYTLKIIYSKDI